MEPDLEQSVARIFAASQKNPTEHDTDTESESDDDEDNMEIAVRFHKVIQRLQIAMKGNFEQKFKARNYLETPSFIRDANMLRSVLFGQIETKRRDGPIDLELYTKSARADAIQMLIRYLRNRQSQSQKSNTDKDIAIFQSSLAINACSYIKAIGFDVELMHPYCTAERRVCHALGLEIDFLRPFGFDKFPEEIVDHLSIEQWICNFLQENYKRERELPENASLPDKELLERIGFSRTNGDAANTLLMRASSLKEHLQTFDWAEMYVKDEFKYNHVLSGISPRFPFAHDISEEWINVRIEEGDIMIHDVNVINLESRNSASYTKQDGCPSFPFGLEDETHKVLFHGTDHDSARDILIHGARITHGRKNRDFSSGSGFYLTDDFEHSVQWAFCSTCKPAVLVYRVNRSLLEAFSGYSLVGEDKRNEWTDLVRQYRSGKPTKKLRKFMRKYDYIEGPRASSCDAVSPEPKQASYQMCVISDELAEALDSSLHSAVFYGGN